MNAKLPLVAVILTLGAGCATHPVSTDITGLRDTRADLPGVPYRIKTQQIVHVFKYDPNKDSYTEVAVIQQLLPDQTKLYALNFQGDLFATRALNVSENSDNTLKSMEVSSTSTDSTLIDTANSTLTGITGAEAAKKTAGLTSSNAVLTADQAVITAQNNLDGLATTASDATRAAYQQALASAKKADNAARIAAGQAPIYP